MISIETILKNLSITINRFSIFAIIWHILFFLFVEPKGHVSIKQFNESILIADDIGFKKIKTIDMKSSYAVLLSKK